MARVAFLARCLAAVMAAWLTAAPAYSETRALLVGVSRYGSTVIPDLVGPANDLVAMERLARGMGGTDVMVLKDAAATRSSVEAALQGIGSRSRPGDWFLLYYSGHGARAAASAGSGENAFDQFVLLPGFDPAKQNPEHFIVDKDFYAWLRRYVPSDVRILMMVDSCHSGSMHRAIDQRAFAFTSRLFRAGGERAFELVSRPGPRLPALRPGAAEAGGDAIREDLPNLAYLGASRDDQLALETELPQEGAPRRGVLTFAFEQGLTTPGRNEASPAADLDGDGMVTLLEISSYLNSQVRLLSAQRQDSTASFPSAWTDLPLFSKLPTPRPPPDFPAPAVVITAAPELRLDIPAVLSWRVTTSADEADFIWDVGTREVVRRSGDLIASGVTSVAAFGGVLEKWQLVQALLPLVSELTMRVFVDPNGSDFLYGAGTTVKLTLSRTERSAGTRYATVFNLASDGTVQLLYPLAGEGDGAFSARDTVSILETSVVAPYGVDHIVAVATPEIPTQLRAALRTADGSRAAGRLLGLIRAELKKAKGRGSLSIAEIYTGS